MTPQDFIAAIAPAAQISMVASKIPASFTIAQGALESTWGGSELALQARNLFSVKADQSWHGPFVLMNSAEYVMGKSVMLPARWRQYPDWQSCIDDRVQFFRLNPRYAACFAETTGAGWARAVQSAGYATDPAYADKLVEVINFHNLTQYDTP